MRKIEEIRSILVRHKEEFEKKYGVTIIGVFGSHTRGEQTPASDLDVLVEVKKPIGFEFFELWDELEKLLGVKVDLLTVKAVKQKRLLRESMVEDMVYVQERLDSLRQWYIRLYRPRESHYRGAVI